MANELQDFTLSDLYQKMFLPDRDFEIWLASQGILHGSMDCPRCQQPMILEQPSNPNSHTFWRCNRAVHRPEKPKRGFKAYEFNYSIFIY